MTYDLYITHKAHLGNMFQWCNILTRPKFWKGAQCITYIELYVEGHQISAVNIQIDGSRDRWDNYVSGKIQNKTDDWGINKKALNCNKLVFYLVWD